MCERRYTRALLFAVRKWLLRSISMAGQRGDGRTSSAHPLTALTRVRIRSSSSARSRKCLHDSAGGLVISANQHQSVFRSKGLY